MTKPCKLARSQRAEAKRSLEGYRACETLLGQTQKMIVATVERIQREEALLSGVRTPSTREALLGLIDAEEAQVEKLRGWALGYSGRMSEVEAALEGGRLDRTSSELLRLRYLERRPWEKIARRLGYSTDYTRGRLHARALEAYAAAVIGQGEQQAGPGAEIS